MSIPPIIPIAILLAIMLSGNLYPKKTMIFIAVAVLLVLMYPLIKAVQASGIAVCHC